MCACNTISIFAITNAECSQSRMLIESIASNWISPLANRCHLSESLKPDNMHWKFPERSRERIPLICWRLKLARISFVVNNKCYWNLHWAQRDKDSADFSRLSYSLLNDMQMYEWHGIRQRVLKGGPDPKGRSQGNVSRLIVGFTPCTSPNDQVRHLMEATDNWNRKLYSTN